MAVKIDINDENYLQTECNENEEIKVESSVVETYDSTETMVEELNGLGGWLILVGLGRVLSPVLLLWAVFNTYLPQFTSGALNTVSEPGNAAYSNLWRPTMLFEFCGNILLLIISVVLVFLFFGKKKMFPKAYIGLLIFTIVFAVIDVLLMSKIQSSISIDLNLNPASQIVKPVITGVIWIPYFLNSIRVKNTFIR